MARWGETCRLLAGVLVGNPVRSKSKGGKNQAEERGGEGGGDELLCGKRREPRSHPTTPGRGGMRNLISSRFTVLCKHRRRRSSSRRPSSRQESVHSLSCDRPQKGERRGLVRSPQSADGRRPARADGRRAPGRRRRWQPQRPRRHRAPSGARLPLPCLSCAHRNQPLDETDM